MADHSSEQTHDRNWFEKTFEVSHGSHKTIRSMEGLRGLAVFLVFLVHFVSLASPWLARDTLTWVIGDWAMFVGNSGVDLFFVLSGYLIYGMLMKKEKPFVPYFKRRVHRIYPTFLAVLALYLVLSYVFPAESKFPAEIGPAVVYLLQNILLIPGIFPIEAIITVAWSLSYEMFYYLFIPLVIGALSLRAWKPGHRALLFLAMAAGWLLVADFFGDLARLVLFLGGVLLYETHSNQWVKKVWGVGIPALILGAVGTVLLWRAGTPGIFHWIVLLVSFFLLCLDCFSSDGLAGKVFSYTPLRWWGNMSYSYYLIHGVTLKGFFLFLGLIYPPTGTGSAFLWIMLVPCLLATMVTSTLLFVFVEKPFSLARKPKPVKAT